MYRMQNLQIRNVCPSFLERQTFLHCLTCPSSLLQHHLDSNHNRKKSIFLLQATLRARFKYGRIHFQVFKIYIKKAYFFSLNIQTNMPQHHFWVMFFRISIKNFIKTEKMEVTIYSISKIVNSKNCLNFLAKDLA